MAGIMAGCTAGIVAGIMTAASTEAAEDLKAAVDQSQFVPEVIDIIIGIMTGI